MSLFKDALDPFGDLITPLAQVVRFGIATPDASRRLERRGFLIDIVFEGENLDSFEPPPHTQWTMTVETAQALVQNLNDAIASVSSPLG